MLDASRIAHPAGRDNDLALFIGIQSSRLYRRFREIQIFKIQRIVTVANILLRFIIKTVHIVTKYLCRRNSHRTVNIHRSSHELCTMVLVLLLFFVQRINDFLCPSYRK